MKEQLSIRQISRMKLAEPNLVREHGSARSTTEQ